MQTQGGILRTKFMPIALTIAALSAFGLASTASAGGTLTIVTIRENSGDFFGKVKSQKAKCFKNRRVALYKQKGPMQVPSEDRKVAQDDSDNEGKWNTGNTGFDKGKFYARAKAIEGCRADNSPTLKL